MFEDATRTPECKVCSAPHDEEIHEATLSVHRWFQQEVTKYLKTPDESPTQQVA
jgi:hypothetical protein